MNLAVSSKEDLIKVCKEIVKEQGIQAVSVRSLAKKAGISVGAVYNYFPSKNQLLVETIGSIWGEIFHFAHGNKSFTSFKECLKALLDSITEGKEKYPHFFTEHALVMTYTHEETGKELMGNFWDHLKKNLLETLIADKHLRKNLFNEDLSQEELVEYIFELFLSVMISEKSPESLLKLVDNLLY